MPRIVLTTCGTSLYNSSCWNWNNLNVDARLSGTSDRIELRRRQIVCEQAIIRAKNQDINGAALASTFDKTSWDDLLRSRDLPAELASLKSINLYLENPQIAQPLTGEDQIVLIHPNSRNIDIDGKFCADVLKKVIIDFNLLPAVPQTNIISKEINNLDPSNREQFGYALKEVLNYATKLQNQGNSLILNLTGGYKALAILLGAFGRQKQGIPIFYLHEEAKYDQIFMMKFENDSIVFTIYDAGNNKIETIYYQETAGPP